MHLTSSRRRILRPRAVLGVLWKLAVVAALWFGLTHRSAVAPGSLLATAPGGPVTRGEVLATARLYAEHRWQPGAGNIRHGPDARGVTVDTPDASGDPGNPERWQPGRPATGMPYKWGGFDTPASFDAGVRAARAAGDLYTSGKRWHGDAAVSDAAVGVDCSGFVCRCWGLPQKYGTARLPGLCRVLPSTGDLQPGDIMDVPQRHVLLFARWLNTGKSRALFYEAEGGEHGKVVASERHLWALRLIGARPLRYDRIRD